ncbi:hypothetical protein ACLB2K_059848 [Fragaria x ananassa]
MTRELITIQSFAWTKPEYESYTYDAKNANLVFNDLIEVKYVRLDHKIPSKEELKDKKYCTFHNVYNHDTKDCVKLRDQLQTWLNSSALKLKTPGSTTSLVDVDPFPPVVGMVEVNWADQPEENNCSRVPKPGQRRVTLDLFDHLEDENTCQAPKRDREEGNDDAFRPSRRYTYNVNLAHEVLDYLIDGGLVTVVRALPYIEYKEDRVHCKFHNSWGHRTRDCYQLREQVQDWLDLEYIHFEDKGGRNRKRPANDYTILANQSRNPEPARQLVTRLQPDRPSRKDSVMSVSGLVV